MSSVKKFLELSGVEKRTLMAALSGLPSVRIRLSLFGFEKTLSKLQRVPLAPKDIYVDPAIYPAQTSRLVNAAARFLFRREACLERSIMLWTMLRQKGIDSELKIGVAIEEQGLQAHAWIEIDDIVINENPDTDERFTAFKSSFTAEHKDNL